MNQEQAGPDVPAQVVVVAVDAARLGLYAATLRMAGVPARSTLDVDEAEGLLQEHQPVVLVLDHGLPRMVVFRLYGLVRETVGESPVKVLFVGQEGDTGPDDHYLPGEPSPLTVAAQVSELVAEVDAATAEPAVSAPEDDISQQPREDSQIAAAASGHPDEARPSGQAGVSEQPELSHEAESDRREAELAGVSAAASAGATPAVTAPAADQALPPGGRRLGVWMFRLGMVLLIIGGLLLFVRPESFSLPMMAPPTVVPGTAPGTPSPAPAASPSPAALFEDAILRLGMGDDRR